MTKPRIIIPVSSMNIQNYINALDRAQAQPVVIHHIEELNIEEADGLLLPGGGDVNPALYGEENKGSAGIEDALDKLQIDVLKQFVDAKKPVLGICRGHQLINVFFGGNMIQDLGSASGHSDPLGEGHDQYHEALSEDNSWINQIYGKEFLINSAHHQAVKTPGKGLIVDLFSKKDHVIEASHHQSLPIWTVQWHPERCLPSYHVEHLVNGDQIFSFFINKVKEHV